MSNILKYMAIAVVTATGALTPAFAADGDKGAAAPAAVEPGTAKAEGGEAGRQRGGHRGPGFRGMKRLDTDNNGSVSKAEFLAPRITEFKSLDGNRDGAVDAAEIGASLAEPADFRTRRYMKRIDADADGKVTLEEFQKGPRAMFAGRDINSDGKINAEDRPPAAAGGYGWFGGGRGDGHRMGLGAGRGKDREMTLDGVLEKSAAEFKTVDANGDGAVDAAELAKQSAARLEFSKKRMMHWNDANTDGRISEDEFTARNAKRFAVLDLNDDGKIDSADFPSKSGGKGWLWK